MPSSLTLASQCCRMLLEGSREPRASQVGLTCHLGCGLCTSEQKVKKAKPLSRV